MFGKLFRPREKVAPQVPRSTPPETVVWAIGDVHGRLDLLAPLIAAVLEDLAQAKASRKVIVFLGDYIDRGANSKGVVDLLSQLKAQSVVETHFLRGNHEDRMEAFLTDPELGPGWCDYGGREALRSYGVLPPMLKTDAEGWAKACEDFNAVFDDGQRAFLAGQAYSVSIGDYFFAHAGAEPGVPLDEQDPQQLMWVRQSFLDHPVPFERMVVHGHTPVEQVHADHRRIGIDTGAYATGVLTGLRLEGEARELLQTAVAAGKVSLNRRPL